MYHLHHVCISLELVLKRCMVCMTACEYMAFMLFSPFCRDDYFLYSVIFSVHHIHCLESFDQLCFTLILSSGCLKELVDTLVVPMLVGMNRRKTIFHHRPPWPKFCWRSRGTAEILMHCWRSSHVTPPSSVMRW